MKNNCLSKSDIESLIEKYIIFPILFVLAVTFILGILFTVVREIYATGCFQTYQLSNNFDGPSYKQCYDLFVK